MKHKPIPMWTPEQWLEQFGQLYGLTTVDYVRRCCRQDVMRNGYRCHLPEHWFALRYGRSLMIVWTGKGRGPLNTRAGSTRPPAIRTVPTDAHLN